MISIGSRYAVFGTGTNHPGDIIVGSHPLPSMFVNFRLLKAVSMSLPEMRRKRGKYLSE